MAHAVEASEISQRLERGESIVFVDARNPVAWGESQHKLPGAVRMPLDSVDAVAPTLPAGAAIVTYCT